MSIFFINDEHKSNFEKLVEKFPQVQKNSEYRATCYVAAHPEIFKCFNLSKQENGPFDWYFEYIYDPEGFLEREDKGETSGDPAPLTGGTRRLVDLALNIWNGREFDLSDGLSMWEHELYLVALQAIDLRRYRPSFDFNKNGGWL